MASISTIRVFASREIAAGESLTSQAFKLGSYSDVQGWFSLHVELTAGTGTAKFLYGMSNNNSNFIFRTDDATKDIVTAHTINSGPASDGIMIYQFSPVLSQWIKIRVTETGGVNPVTVSAWLAIQ